jgi:cobalt-zinc-cadmium resistance protein CzcA
VVPLTLLLIASLLYMTFRELSPALLIPTNVPLASTGGVFALALLILTNVPLASTGGVFALALRGLPFTISAGVGFIALFGVAVLNGLVLVSQILKLREEGMAPREAAETATLRRLRPVLTDRPGGIARIRPHGAIATGAGAEVRRPLATVVIGGLMTSSTLTLLVVPALHAWFAERFSSATLSGSVSRETAVPRQNPSAN